MIRNFITHPYTCAECNEPILKGKETWVDMHGKPCCAKVSTHSLPAHATCDIANMRFEWYIYVKEHACC